MSVRFGCDDPPHDPATDPALPGAILRRHALAQGGVPPRARPALLAGGRAAHAAAHDRPARPRRRHRRDPRRHRAARALRRRHRHRAARRARSDRARAPAGAAPAGPGRAAVRRRAGRRALRARRRRRHPARRRPRSDRTLGGPGAALRHAPHRPRHRARTTTTSSTTTPRSRTGQAILYSADTPFEIESGVRRALTLRADGDVWAPLVKSLMDERAPLVRHRRCAGRDRRRDDRRGGLSVPRRRGPSVEPATRALRRRRSGTQERVTRTPSSPSTSTSSPSAQISPPARSTTARRARPSPSAPRPGASPRSSSPRSVSRASSATTSIGAAASAAVAISVGPEHVHRSLLDDADLPPGRRVGQLEISRHRHARRADRSAAAPGRPRSPAARSSRPRRRAPPAPVPSNTSASPQASPASSAAASTVAAISSRASTGSPAARWRQASVQLGARGPLGELDSRRRQFEPEHARPERPLHANGDRGPRDASAVAAEAPATTRSESSAGASSATSTPRSAGPSCAGRREGPPPAQRQVAEPSREGCASDSHPDAARGAIASATASRWRAASIPATSKRHTPNGGSSTCQVPGATPASRPRRASPAPPTPAPGETTRDRTASPSPSRRPPAARSGPLPFLRFASLSPRFGRLLRVIAAGRPRATEDTSAIPLSRNRSRISSIATESVCREPAPGVKSCAVTAGDPATAVRRISAPASAPAPMRMRASASPPTVPTRTRSILARAVGAATRLRRWRRHPDRLRPGPLEQRPTWRHRGASAPRSPAPRLSASRNRERPGRSRRAAPRPRPAPHPCEPPARADIGGRVTYLHG